jgi:subtilisin family serine protease
VLLLALACTPAVLPEDAMTLDELRALDPDEVHPERILVLDEGLPLSPFGLETLRVQDNSFGRLQLVWTPDDPVQAVADLRASGIYAEPDLRFHHTGQAFPGVMSAAALEDDPLARLQWHMDNVGQAEAWSMETGAGATVAVVDTGVSTRNDGPTGLVAGYDFVDEDSDPSDEEGHGTHVAGTIAQATGNGKGVHGLAPDVDLLSVRVLDENGSGWTSDIIAGIDYATEYGADVINLSLGSYSKSSLQRQALQRAEDAGVLVVAANGNDSVKLLMYPAAFPEAVAVSALDLDNVLTHYSNYGYGTELCAPGGDTGADLDDNGHVDGVLQETFSGDSWGYYWYQGTSMATPHVVGAAALLMASGQSAREARETLQSTATDLGRAGLDNRYGYGLIDPAAALSVGGQPSLMEMKGYSNRGYRKVAFATENKYEVEVCDDGGTCIAFPRTKEPNTRWYWSPDATSYTVTLTALNRTRYEYGPFPFEEYAAW